MLNSEVGMDNRTELLGQIYMNKLVMTREAAKDTCPSWQGEHMQSPGWDGGCV